LLTVLKTNIYDELSSVYYFNISLKFIESINVGKITVKKND
jgi:hypothetical protein